MSYGRRHFLKAELKKIVYGAHFITLGTANAVALNSEQELTIVDAGFPETAMIVFREVSFS